MAMEMKRKMSLCHSVIFNASCAWMDEYYTHVAVIEASDLDDVFEIGNMGSSSEIVITQGTKMHSISVGDIIENDTTKEKFVVADCGFEKIILEEDWFGKVKKEGVTV